MIPNTINEHCCVNLIRSQSIILLLKNLGSFTPPVLRMVAKLATGLTGLAVASNPHHTLSALYGKILRALTKMPQDASYRKYTEKVVQNRLKAVEAHKNVIDLEKEISCGQVEELIVQAENELILARKMLGWKPWESLVKPAPHKQWNWPPAKIDEPMI